jgi:hypothetical protein
MSRENFEGLSRGVSGDKLTFRRHPYMFYKKVYVRHYIVP